MPRALKKDIIDRIIGGALDTNLEKTITDDANELLNTAVLLKAANKEPVSTGDDTTDTSQSDKKGFLRRLLDKFKRNKNTENKASTDSPKTNANINSAERAKIQKRKEEIKAEQTVANQEKDKKTIKETNEINAKFTNTILRVGALTAATYGPIQLGLITIAVIALFAGFIVAIYYFIITINKIRTRFSIQDPLNTETIDWEVIKSFSKYKGSFNFLIFLILPAISVICIILVFILTPIFETKINIPGEVKSLVAGVGVLAFIMLILQLVVSYLLSSQIKAIGVKLVNLNTEIYSRFTTKVGVLTPLKTIRDSGFDIEQEVIKHGLSYISETSSVEDIAKIFYTITLFIYYHNLLGTRDTHLYESLKVFTLSNLMIRFLSPSDFFPKYGTYVPLQDMTFELNLSTNFKDVYTKNAATIRDAFQLYRNWISELNLDANSIYPGKATVSYYVLWIVTFIIQSIPVMILLSILFGAGPNSPVSRILGFIKNKLF